MKHLIPDSLAARTLVVLFLGLALSHALSIALYTTDRTDTLISIDGKHIGDRIATIDRLTRNSTPPERQRLITLASEASFKVSLSSASAIKLQPQTSNRTSRLRQSLVAHLDTVRDRDIRIRYKAMKSKKSDNGDTDEVNSVLISISQQGPVWLNFAVSLQPAKSFWSFRYTLSMIVMLSAVVFFSSILVEQLTRPLQQFARASQKLGVDVTAPPLAEKGPLEIRLATQAFNQMQRRIRRFVEDRTQMIAAISHDLGTPIARMRLRAEFVDDAEQQQKMLADLEHMEKMVFSALSFTRDDSTREPMAKVDFKTMLHRVCDDITDAGFKVSLTIEEENLVCNCRPVALRRALNNLVENAARYGGEARVAVAKQSNGIVVTIDDDGPGIPEDRHEDVFKPFYRLETSRSHETGGTGLGMTVARSTIRAHGGDIKLSNRDEGGLRMEVSLPTI